MSKQKQPSIFSSCASGLLLFLLAGSLIVYGVSKLVKMGLNSEIATTVKESLKEFTEEQTPEQIVFPDSDDEIRDVEVPPIPETIPLPVDGIQIGGLYAFLVDDQYYNLYKVTAVRDDYVFLTLYGDRYSQLPERVSSEDLYPLMNNIKIVKAGFKAMDLQLISTEPVRPEELEPIN